MRLISIDEITGKEVTAEDIRSDIDFILIPKDTILKPSYISALKNLNIREVCVKDMEEESDVSNTQGIFFPEEMLQYYADTLNQIINQNLEEVDYCKIEVLAEKIVDFIKDNPDIKYSIKTKRNHSISQHSVVVTILSILIALKLDITRPRMYQIAIACLLHDMGLMKLPFSIEGLIEEELNQEQLQAYHNHPIDARNMIESISWITEDSKEMVLSHHERASGNGFPYKKKRQSLGCRIIQAADFFDGRCIGIEGEQMETEELFAFMEARKCCRFDRTIVEFLFQVIAK